MTEPCESPKRNASKKENHNEKKVKKTGKNESKSMTSEIQNNNCKGKSRY